MTVKVTVKDRGAKRAEALLRQPRKMLRIGVLEAEAAQPHPTRYGRTTGQVAVWAEYGTRDGHVPPRRWLFGWLDLHIEEITQQLATDTMRVIFSNESEKSALEKRGTVYRRQIIDRIEFSNDIPKIEASTIRRKGGLDTPLIDTEWFIDRIRYEVVDGL